jgi:hypothetical protein
MRFMRDPRARIAHGQRRHRGGASGAASGTVATRVERYAAADEAVRAGSGGCLRTLDERCMMVIAAPRFRGGSVVSSIA